MVSKELVVVLVVLTVLLGAIPFTASAQDIIAFPLWTENTRDFAWFLDDNHVLLGDAIGKKAPRADVTYSKHVDYVVYTEYVEIRDAKTGNVLWSDDPPANTIRVAKPAPDRASLIKVVDIPFDFAYNLSDVDRGLVWAVPYGIVTANDTHFVIFDYDGNVKYIFCWKEFENYGYPAYSKALTDSIWVTPDGELIVALGGWFGKETGVESQDDNDIVLFNRYLTPIKLIDGVARNIEAITLTEGYIALASNQLDNCIIIIDRDTYDYAFYNGTPVAETDQPVYMSLLATIDGKYLFALKEINDNTDEGVLEVWEWNGGTSISLVETYNVTITGRLEDGSTVDNVQPMGFSEASFSETFPYGVMVNTLIYYDSTTGEYSVLIYNSTITNRLAGISPQAQYAILGNTMYILVHQDVQSGEPRIRFEGDLIYNPTQAYPWELSSAFILEAPEDKPYHIYFESGSIKITYVSAEERPVELITDSNIVNGKLGNMLDRGLVKYDIIYTDGATVKDHTLTKMDERTVVYERTHVLQTWTYARFFGVSASTADSGVVIEVPLDAKLTPYSELTLDPKFAVSVVIPQFDPAGELMGVSGQIIGSGASLYTAKSLAKGWLRDYLLRKGFDELAIYDAVSMWARGATKWGSRACFIIGVALAVDAGMEFYTHYENLKEYENIKTTVYTIPILIDSKTGEKYAVVEYFLPQDASEHENDFKNHVISYLESLGIPSSNIKIRVSYIIDTWDNYMDIIEAGKIPRTNLLELSKMITEVPTERLKIDKIVIVIDTITSGYASTFDLLGGGYHESLATIVYGNSIQVSGTISGFDTKDPEEIASLIPKVEINGQEYSVSPSTDGAIVQFTLPIGTDKLIVRFPNAEHLRAIFQLKATTLVKAPMTDKGGYYEANFHYDWKYGDNNLVIVTKRMEFVDMPYPMEYAEREIKLLYGRVEPLEITNYFELSQVINDSNSPSGKRYYYVTQDPKFLDPSNGARMQTCKQYIFRYWYTTPPQPYEPQPNETIPINETEPLPPNATSPWGNAWIKLYLNGTTNASVIPRMLVAWVGSTGTDNNAVSVRIIMKAGYLDSEDRPIYTMNETRTFTVTVPPNSTYVQFYDIQKFIAEAIEHAPRGFFEAVGVITQATYNKIISDDADRVTYFPPSTLPPEGNVVALSVKVVDAVNLTAVEGATVYLDGSTFGTTNAEGWANGTTTVGLHKIKVEKNGYQTYESDLNVFDNMSITIELIPETLPTTYNKLEILVQYQDGAPYEGATVTVKNNTTGTTLFTQNTDALGLAEFMIESGKTVDIFITAGNYTFNFTGVVMDKDKRIVATVPENTSYFTPEVAISNVTFKIHWGMGWYYGRTPHLVETWVFSNVPQTITLHYRAFDVETNESLNETDLTVDVHKGINYIMNWVYLAVRNETKDVAVEVSITSYGQDTNLENNKMVSNSVTIKPFIDLSVTVLWKPIRQKTPLAILPEDVIEIDVGFMIPCKLSGIEIRTDVNSHDLFTKKLNPLERHHDIVTSFKPNTTIWYNTTVVVPFTDKIVVNASIHHPWEYMGWNNYINTTIEIFPDTEVSDVSIGALVVQSGQDVDITVKLRSNAIGRGTTISVFDENVEDVIGTAHVEITEPEMEVKLKAKAPIIGASVKTEQFNFSEIYETHTWNVSSATVDYWTENDYQKIQVTIWNIPWWVWILIAIIVIIFILAVVHALLTTVRDRMRPRYRFFKKLEGEEVSDRFGLTTEEKGYKKFKFFRRLK